MTCLTCDHAVQLVINVLANGCWGADGAKISWCPRCGTLVYQNCGKDKHDAPRLVERCRKFEDACGLDGGVDGETPRAMWARLGIKESIR